MWMRERKRRIFGLLLIYVFAEYTSVEEALLKFLPSQSFQTYVTSINVMNEKLSFSSHLLFFSFCVLVHALNMESDEQLWHQFSFRSNHYPFIHLSVHGGPCSSPYRSRALPRLVPTKLHEKLISRVHKIIWARSCIILHVLAQVVPSFGTNRSR